MKNRKTVFYVLAIIILITISLLSARRVGFVPRTTPTQPFADELILYSWVDYMPQSVMDEFTREYGIKINYIPYDSEEEAEANLRAGKVYDLVVLSPDVLPRLIKDGYMAKIDYQNVVNFKNISANFRDLAFDPGNEHSIPFHWGTTGLLYRTDLVKKPITSWLDLWDPEFAGKVAIFPISRSVIPITLKALGYPANSEDPAQLQKALEQLLELRKNSFLVGNDNASLVPVLENGSGIIGYGWAYDALTAKGLPIAYVIPKEGSILWGDHFVIPVSSQHKRTAELFLDFILRPKISAEIINQSYYPMANDAAVPFIDPTIYQNPIVYPSAKDFEQAEMTVGLSPEGQKLYDQIWQKFLDAGPQ